MTRDGIGRRLRQLRRRVYQCTGGLLPEPLATGSTLVTAIVAAVVLLAFSHTLPGLVIGLILAAAVWYMEIVDALTAKASVLRTHAQPSVSSICCLCLGLAGLYANRADHLVWLEWTCLGVLALTGWLASAYTGFLTVTPLAGTANLKHNPADRTTPRVQIKQLLRTIWTAIGITGVLAALALPATPWATLAATTITTAIVTWALATAWRYADRARWGAIRELRRLKPQAMIPYGGSAVFHVPMWEPYVGQIGVNYFLLTFKPQTVPKLAASTTHAPIVSPGKLTKGEINAIVPPSVTVAFYVHNSKQNDLCLANKQISSVWLHHGDGDKQASHTSRSSIYDYLFVAGQGAMDRYRNHGVHIPQKKFRIIGRPQTEAITTARSPIKEKIHPVVLYAPTWAGKKTGETYSSLAMGPDIVDTLLTHDVSVHFRPHSWSHSNRHDQKIIDSICLKLEQDAAATGRQHVWGEQAETRTVADATNSSDAMIADVSGVVTDFLQSGKPYAMVSPRWPADEFRQKFPTSRSAYVIDQSAGSIDAALDAMLGDDPLADYRWQRRSYYLGGFDGHESVDRFVEESRKLLQHGNAQATTT